MIDGDKMLIFPAPDRLMKLAESLKEKYRTAEPFPHIVIENFFEDSTLDQVLTEFPKPGDIKWRKTDNNLEKKLASRGEHQFGPSTQQFGRYLNSAFFLSFLEEITGISGLIPDPFFDGGGLHQIVPGGVLKIHADFNKHDRTGLDRRLNVLIYLNKDWKDEYGGNFELWDREMKGSKLRIAPLFNRLVVFSTTSTSYHGHPDPLTCPPDRTRKSFATYYYTHGRPTDEVSNVHSTLFKMREGEEHLQQLEDRRWKKKLIWRQTKKIARSLVPPIFFGKIE